MSDGRDPGSLAHERTPATYSYSDALLQGRMTASELEAVRAEILEGTLPPPASAERPVARGAPDPLDEIRKRIDARDYSGALHLAEDVLAADPTSAPARRYVDLCGKMLCRVYIANLGDRDDVPRVVLSPEALGDLGLDAWAGFVLSRIDGWSSIDDLADMAGMPRLDALRILYDLVRRGAVRIEKKTR